MGVTYLVRWKNATGMLDLNALQENVTKHLQGNHTGRWNIACKVYRDTSPTNKAGSGKLMYAVSFSQKPRVVYCMVEGGVLVAADRELDTILGKLKNCWAVRQTIIVEGAIFEVGDFTLRIANLLLGQAYKGLLLEIEYGPATAPNSALGPIQNFLQAITPSTAQLSYETTYDYRSVGLSDTDFSAAHTGYQYMSFLKREGLL